MAAVSALSRPLLSRYGELALQPAPVSRMMAAFSAGFRPGVDVNLGVGYVNEDTMPSAEISEAVAHVLSHPVDFPHALNYGMPAGEPVLVDAIKRFYLRNGIGGLTAEQLDAQSFLIGASGVTSLLEALGSVLEPGVVITTDPLYYIYAHLLERLGFQIVSVAEDAEGMDAQALEQALATHGAQVRFVYIVTVSNPTSTVLSNGRRRALAAAVTRASRALARQIPLVVDTAYELLIHDEATEPPLSLVHFDPELLVYELGTLSKMLAPSLRIGYLFGAKGPLYGALMQRVNDIGFSAPPLSQFVAARLLDTCGDSHRQAVNAGYRRKARLAQSLLVEHLGSEVDSYSGGKAGFYLYVTFKAVATGEGSDFFRFAFRETGEAAIDGQAGAREPRVLFLPGEHCVHSRGSLREVARRQLRISYGYASDAELTTAFEILGAAMLYARRALQP